MRVIIAGSRTIAGPGIVETALANCSFEPTLVISGTANGPDMMGEEWARKNAIDIELFPADWETHGRRAGMLRNAEMARFAEALVALWDGSSKGTANMIETMQRMEKPVHVHRVITQLRGVWSGLSNMAELGPVTFQDLEYRSVEAVYQSLKTQDMEKRKSFCEMSGPEAKKIGRGLRLRPDWDSIKVRAMAAIIAAAYKPGTNRADLLLFTEDASIVEGNTWGDTFWGVCNGRGRNILGRILEAQRSRLRS